MTTAPATRTASRRVILAGASGLVGGHLLKGLLDDASVAEVQVVGRRPLAQSHAKLRSRVVDFRAVPALSAADEVYLALGTTIKVAGSREAFRTVDYDANLAVARAALAAGARRIGLVSAMGADARSRVFYSRVKGELEDAILALRADTTVIVRPSLLLGDRRKLGQPERAGETFATVIMQPLQFLVPRNYRPVLAEKVARALLVNLPARTGSLVLSSAELQSY